MGPEKSDYAEWTKEKTGQGQGDVVRNPPNVVVMGRRQNQALQAQAAMLRPDEPCCGGCTTYRGATKAIGIYGMVCGLLGVVMGVAGLCFIVPNANPGPNQEVLCTAFLGIIVGGILTTVLNGLLVAGAVKRSVCLCLPSLVQNILSGVWTAWAFLNFTLLDNQVYGGVDSGVKWGLGLALVQQTLFVSVVIRFVKEIRRGKGAEDQLVQVQVVSIPNSTLPKTAPLLNNNNVNNNNNKETNNRNNNQNNNNNRNNNAGFTDDLPPPYVSVTLD